MTRFLILVVLVALAAPALHAQTVVIDTVAMTKRVASFEARGVPSGGTYLFNCWSQVIATWPDLLTDIGLPGGITRYGVHVPGSTISTLTPVLSADGYPVPTGHLGHAAITIPGRFLFQRFNVGDEPDRTPCAERAALAQERIAQTPPWYATFAVNDGTPIALFEWEPAEGLSVAFDASFESGQSREIDSTQPTGKRPVASYAWDFGDDNRGTGPRTGPKPVYTFHRGGTFNVTLTVTDDDGQTNDHVEVVIVESVLTVNSIDDAADDDLTDDLCDTGQEVEVDGEMVPECTLRAALELANARGGDRITFKIPGDGVPVISVGDTGLPHLSSPITIDGTTQPGGWVELVGPGQDDADPTISGISVESGGGGSTLRGLVIHGFKEAGVSLRPGADGCTLEGNRIGTDATGLLAKGNGGFFGGAFSSSGLETWGGVWIESDDNRIIDNIIAGNFAPDPNGGAGGTDVFIGGSRNILEGNNIGVGADGVPLVLPARSVNDLYFGVLILNVTDEIFGNRIGGPGEIGGSLSCATPQCNTIQGHSVEVALGSSSRSAFAGRGTVIRGNVIGSGFNLPTGAIPTAVGISYSGVANSEIPADASVAFNYIQAEETGISIDGSDIEVLGNTVSVGARPPRNLVGPQLDNYWAIETGPDATVTQNTVSSAWIGVSAGRGTTVSNNRFSAAVAVLVRSDSPVVMASQNANSNCGGQRPDAGLVHLGGSFYNPHSEPASPQRLNDWGDIDGYVNSPIIVRAERSGDQVRVLGYVRTAPTVSEVAIEMFACGNGDYVKTLQVPTSAGVTEFELTQTDVETEAYAFTATHDGESTSQGMWARIAPQAFISSVEVPSVGPAASASGQGADLTVVAGSPGRTSRQAGARVFITRFNTQPDTSVFADTTATAPNGESIQPEAIAFRTWVLRDIGLSRESVDPAVAATFDVCFEVSDDVVDPEQHEAVVIVQRSAPGFDWRPLATTLEPRDGTPALCARSLETLGEFGFGGAEGAFPVSAEPDDGLGVSPFELALRTFPNPASGLLSVEGAMPQAGTARVTIQDALGREVAVLQDGPLAAGTHTFSLETVGLAPGLYHVRLTTPGGTAMRRVTVVR